MENSKKPSSIFLLESHYYVDKDTQGTLFTEEMLDWEIMSGKFNINPERCRVYRTALKAMLRLHPFEIRFSMGVDIPNKKLIAPLRDWALITLEKIHAARFSHYKTGGAPLSSLYEWHLPEEFDPKSLDWKIRKLRDQWRSIVYAMPVDGWVDFFKENILKRCVDLNNKARRKQREICEIEKSSSVILKTVSLIV